LASVETSTSSEQLTDAGSSKTGQINNCAKIYVCFLSRLQPCKSSNATQVAIFISLHDAVYVYAAVDIRATAYSAAIIYFKSPAALSINKQHTKFSLKVSK